MEIYVYKLDIEGVEGISEWKILKKSKIAQ